MANNQSGVVKHTILILVGLFFILVLIGFFSSNYKAWAPKIDNNSNLTNSNSNQNQNSTNQDFICGIKVNSPASGSKVSFPLLITGYINGCGWTAFEGQAGRVQIVDNAGNYLSLPTMLTVSGSWTQLPANFQTTINLIASPQTSTGYLIFQNEDPSGANSKTQKLYIKF